MRIEIAPGVYEEKLFIRKENLEICAQEGGVLFRCGDGAKKPRPDGSGPYGTFNTAVLFLAGKDITVKNIAFENTAGCGAAAGQALALFCAADRCSFLGCRLTGEDKEKSVYLGRPWRDFAKTAFIRCELGSHICPEGWQNWRNIRAEAVCSYIEHACTGPGACASRRVPFAKVLLNPETASYFSRENILSGRDDWQPPSC